MKRPRRCGLYSKEQNETQLKQGFLPLPRGSHYDMLHTSEVGDSHFSVNKPITISLLTQKQVLLYINGVMFSWLNADVNGGINYLSMKSTGKMALEIVE